MQLADIIGSIRRHWRVSVALLLLSGIALGVFLFTRKQVRGEDRWEASALLLVPTRGKDGSLPGGVPPELLQGQAQLAFAATTLEAAYNGAGIKPEDRADVTFAFASNFDPSSTKPGSNNSATGRGDILTLRVTAPSEQTAVKLSQSYADAYRAARSQKVGSDLKSTQNSARNSLQVYQTRLQAVDNQLQATDPALLAQIRASDGTNATGGTNGTDQSGATIPVTPDAPIDTVLLAYEHRTLVTKILGARQTYADSIVGSLTPSAFASVVERPNPIQIVPALPSPFVPALAALAIGLLLAIGVPVLMDVLDHTIRDPRAAMRALSAPVLSTLPVTSDADFSELAVPGTALESAYRALATTSVATDQLPRAIVVTAPVGDAQDAVAANFAAALAELGLEVALVATSARQDWFVDATATDRAPTLTDMLAVASAGRLNGQIRERLVPSRLANLTVLAPSDVESDDLLEGLPRLFEGLASAGVDVTVVAAPSLLEDPSATIFAWSTRSVLWVIETGEVTDVEAREAASRLELAGASAFGVAVVSAPD
jgi:Mrp family chromosome partitioning ATPase